MPADPRRRQKKLERRAAKRKSKHHEFVRARSAGLPERLAEAARFPVADCWVTPALFTNQGIGQLGLSRRLPTGDYAVAVFLVDRFCLGIKDTIAEILSPSQYERRILQTARRDMNAEPIDPPSLRKIVEGAVAYARQLGLSPHPDYARGRLLLGDIDPAQAQRDCEFGQDGKPYFVAGPYDTPERCRQILRILRDSCGPHGFHFLIPVRSDEDGETAEYARELGISPVNLIRGEEVVSEDEEDEEEEDSADTPALPDHPHPESPAGEESPDPHPGSPPA